MSAEICRVTEVRERTPILAVCNAAKQIGIFTAPAFQLLFSYCHFKVFSILDINPLNAAGAFLGVIFLLFLGAALAMFSNLTAELEQMERNAKKARIRSERGVSVSESMLSRSLERQDRYGRATFSIYVDGEYWRCGAIFQTGRNEPRRESTKLFL